MSIETIFRRDLQNADALDARHRLTKIAYVPMMSDYQYQLNCLQDRMDHPKKYAKIENVPETITTIKKWLAEHTPPEE